EHPDRRYQSPEVSAATRAEGKTSEEWLAETIRARIENRRWQDLVRQARPYIGDASDAEVEAARGDYRKQLWSAKNNSALRISTIRAIGSDVKSALRVGRFADVTSAEPRRNNVMHLLATRWFYGEWIYCGAHRPTVAALRSGEDP